jgi:DNA-binding GntR family transcriptional regulator
MTRASPRPDAPASALELLREQSLATLAQQELERRIVSGEFAAGAKLNEVDVATAAGHLARAGARGLQRAQPGRPGAGRKEPRRLRAPGVAGRGQRVLRGARGARRADRQAGRAPHRDRRDRQLRGVVKRMHLVQKSRKADEYFVLNVEFHDLLARAARNNALLANYRGVVNQLDLYRRATISRSLDNIPLSTAEHEAIIDAVSARDEARAQALLTQHVLVSRERLHAALGVPAPCRPRQGLKPGILFAPFLPDTHPSRP